VNFGEHSVPGILTHSFGVPMCPRIVCCWCCSDRDSEFMSITMMISKLC